VALFRLRLKLQGPVVTPFASGTLFGMVCLALAEHEGEAALRDWLGVPERLWAFSDVLPAGLLPRPLVAPVRALEGQDTAILKAARRHRFITREGFLEVRNTLTARALEPHLRSVHVKTVRLAHNTIDRASGSTPDRGGLFFVDEDWSWGLGPDRDMYVEADDSERAQIEALLCSVGDRGFGRKAGLGRGRFSVVSVDLDRELEEGPLDRLMSLSRGAVTPGMGDVRARLAPHFGKAGPEIAVGQGASPFKRPLLLTEPGATFVPGSSGRHGAWLTGVHPTRPEIGHNAFHVTVGFREAAA
jgi:CRISPR-associated protein Csm4